MAQVLSVFVVHGGEYFFDVQFCQYFEGFQGLLLQRGRLERAHSGFCFLGGSALFDGFHKHIFFFYLVGSKLLRWSSVLQSVS